MTYNIWMEGFLCTGMEGTPAPASFVGQAEGNTFKEAVVNWYKNHPDRLLNFNEEHLTDWGCRLYPSEGEARRSFG